MKTVLVIDDEKKFRKRYKDLLKPLKFKVIQAKDAVEVANALMRAKSDLELVVLDINMAEVDGRDTFEIIDEYVPNIPVVISSVFPINEQKLRIPRATDYFNKSDPDDVLVAKVKHILGLE